MNGFVGDFVRNLLYKHNRKCPTRLLLDHDTIWSGRKLPMLKTLNDKRDSDIGQSDISLNLGSSEFVCQKV